MTRTTLTNKVKILSIFFLAFLCHSCFSIKPTSTKTGKKYFETFFVGEDGTQYFIKPLSFINKEKKEELFVDFTFRYKDTVKDSVIVNLSIEGPQIYKNIDSLSISNIDHKITAKDINLLFNEKTDESFKSRFSTKIPLIEIKELSENSKWSFTMFQEIKSTEYKSTNSTENALTVLKDKIFVLM